MATHLDLEEQEQLDQFKHFWAKYGNLISWVLIVVFGAIAAWNGWNYWQRTQAAKAAALYDAVEQAANAKDTTRLDQALSDMQSGFGGTTYAAQSALLAAKVQLDAGQADKAKAALAWVQANSKDDSYVAVARLRLAALELEAKNPEQALKVLDAKVPASFEPLVADRRGDVLMTQGKPEEAKAQYEKAWSGLAPDNEYRRLVEVKLASLGVNKSVGGAQ
jgi:predicted negative regulator of RcsB-dependent stress response